MAVVDELKTYIFNELPQRVVILKNEEANGNPNLSELDKVKNAPLGSQYLREDIIPHPLYVRVNIGTDKDWILLNSNGATENKTISFQFFGKISEKIKEIIIPFPYNGEIKNITTGCNISSNIDTTIQIQKISESDFVTTDNWIDITDGITILKNKKTNELGYILKSPLVNKGDFFRVKLITLDSTIQYLNVQISIDLK